MGLLNTKTKLTRFKLFFFIPHCSAFHDQKRKPKTQEQTNQKKTDFCSEDYSQFFFVLCVLCVLVKLLATTPFFKKPKANKKGKKLFFTYSFALFFTYSLAFFLFPFLLTSCFEKKIYSQRK